jgi:hypothetical protein
MLDGLGKPRKNVAIMFIMLTLIMMTAISTFLVKPLYPKTIISLQTQELLIHYFE